MSQKPSLQNIIDGLTSLHTSDEIAAQLKVLNEFSVDYIAEEGEPAFKDAKDIVLNYLVDFKDREGKTQITRSALKAMVAKYVSRLNMLPPEELTHQVISEASNNCFTECNKKYGRRLPQGALKSAINPAFRELYVKAEEYLREQEEAEIKQHVEEDVPLAE